MYTFLIVLILIASVLMVLAVLVQSPKSGMASNFGASNQVMGVRQTTDFLEKFTWGVAVTILVLSLVSVAMIDGKKSTVNVPKIEKPNTDVDAPNKLDGKAKETPKQGESTEATEAAADANAEAGA